MIPRAKNKEIHKPINQDRRYEVDEIAVNGSKPRTIIPQEYWEDLEARTNAYLHKDVQGIPF